MKVHYANVKHNILQVKLDKRTDVYNWGLDNSFPSLIETLINQSVTAKASVDKVAKAIYGKSFGKIGKTIVNKDGQSLNEVLRIASREYAKHNNVFIHVGYNALFEIKSIKVIPNTSSRIGKADDLGYSGKYVIYDNWNREEGRVDSDAFRIYDKFNPIKKVIEAQIEKAGTITAYKGQILHVQKDTNSIYSLSDINPVLSDCVTEIDAQTYRSTNIGDGFIQNKLLTTQPFSNDDDRRAFISNLNKLRGAENTGSVLFLESAQMNDDLSNQYKLDDLTTQADDTQFEYSESQAEKNICKALGVPLILVNPSDNSMFGNSGEVLRQAKIQLWDEKEEQRDQIEEVFQMLMSNFHEPLLEELQIINPNPTTNE
ncbi:hypothetical protein [Olleya marilimosa]|uniref:hypothetical protein n=1 Tax=Olleya marilimosa TaxID=272164 RepID=UPI0030EF2E47|tara:strand:- start:89149 stop:90264 length:1116 start_codon:yes stop_codon:yes gene_type:complete